ncbi:SH3 domain-containing protein, partial [Acidobacteriota bacterium]
NLRQQTITVTKNRTQALIFSAASLLLFLSLWASPIYGQKAYYKLKVIAEVANIRQSPDIGSPIIHQLAQGTIMEATQKQEEWYTVEMTLEDEKIISGFVHESLVLEIERRVPEEEILETEVVEEEEIKEEPQEEVLETEVVEEEPIQTVQTISEAEEEFAPERIFSRFTLSFSGGLNYIVVGDLNEGAQGLSDFYGATLGETPVGTVSPLHWSYILGGELSYYLTPKMTINLGIDYFYGNIESTVEFPDRKFAERFTTGPKVRDIPVGLTLSYYPYPFLRLKVGVEYHIAKCKYYYMYEEEDRWQEWRGNASSSGLGFMGGIGVEKAISPRLILFLEAAGRYAQIENFEGTDEYLNSQGATSTEKGKLYIWEGHLNEVESYPLVYIREKKPSEANVSNARLAIVDFSGFYIKVGIKIKF